MPVSEIPTLLTKVSGVHDRRRHEPLGGSGCMLPQGKKLDICFQGAISCILRSQSMENSGVFSLTFSSNKHKIKEEIERHQSIPRINANFAQSRGNPVHFRTQNYCSLMLGYQKGKMAEKSQRNN